MKRYKPKNQTYEKAFGALLNVNHVFNLEFTEGQRWHKVAFHHGVMHWFEEVDEFSHLPKSVKEIDGRKWFINSVSQVVDAMDFERDDADNNCLSTKERAEAFLALMQLVELRDAWNGDWKANWHDDSTIYTIEIIDGCISVIHFYVQQSVLHFRTIELAEKFLDTFKDLIETAKELI